MLYHLYSLMMVVSDTGDGLSSERVTEMHDRKKKKGGIPKLFYDRL